jgi:hypothetical protein
MIQRWVEGVHMDRGRVGEDRGSKETDGCPLTVFKNPEHHGRMKHLDLRFYWLRDTMESGLISPSYIPTSEMVADIFTKPLPLA